MSVAFIDNDELCLNCMRFHAPPWCNHDSRRPCRDCGKPVGYRATGDDGKALGTPFRCTSCNWKAVA